MNRFRRGEAPRGVCNEVEKREDERGFFARRFCEGEFEAHGLSPRVGQCSTSFDKKMGTLARSTTRKLPRDSGGAIRHLEFSGGLMKG